MKLGGITTMIAAALLLALLWPAVAAAAEESCSGIVPMRSRREVISIEDYGGVGDGRTDNSWPFRKAIYRIQHQRRRDGTLLYVPRGIWLTGCFNLTSHMTLYLARGAVIKATQDTKRWPLVEPLPSYGRGRERPGGRYASFILGYGLRDVIITGENGTIDGQGGVWWEMWRQRTLSFTRPNLIEFMHSTDIHISNVIFKNSPFWNIHPVYCRPAFFQSQLINIRSLSTSFKLLLFLLVSPCSNVVIRSVTVLAPHDSPNTDGIDPDSSSNVCIEDSFISTGDDAVAIKSGWDEYGISYGRPSTFITIQRITAASPFSAIAIGSEASGGIQHILIRNINIHSTAIAIHIKTNAGRGGYITNVTISDVHMSRVAEGVRIVGDVGDHPDGNFNPGALTRVDGVTIRDVWGVGVREPGAIEGIKGSPFTRICLSNVRLWGVGRRMEKWKCGAVSGVAVGVEPWPCAELAGTLSMGFCY